MRSVGIRELRQRASEIVRRVAEEGETYEITDRGRPAGLLVPPRASGLKELERRGLVRRAEGDLLSVRPLRLRRGQRRPSAVVDEGRSERD
ncbi:MAG: type II toxin-antitoxin system Phd/YefM family antitoxin [Chloroflexota bacterium]|nr:type II toxin-antitoxin system Phd/YefM family antitoxin [Chloroflexota bacterium]